MFFASKNSARLDNSDISVSSENSFGPGKELKNNLSREDDKGNKFDEKLSAEQQKQYSIELTALCAKNKNNLDFIFVGGDNTSRQVKIREDILASLSDTELKDMKFWLAELQHFINSPVFTDDFHQDNVKRHEWSKVNVATFPVELKNYYLSNRLQLNNLSAILGFAPSVIEHLRLPEIKNDLNKLFSQLPPEITTRDEKGILEYNKLSDAHKLGLIYKTTSIAKDILAYLEPINKD